MGLFGRLFGKRKSVASSPELFDVTADTLDYCITTLRIWLFQRLYRMYAEIYGEEAKYLGAAILNDAFAEESSNDAAKQYRDRNRDLVVTETKSCALAEISRRHCLIYTQRKFYIWT